MEKLVTIASFNFPIAADSRKLLLEREGIRAFLADDTVVGMDWFLSNAVGGVKLQVAEADVQKAIEIFNRYPLSKSELQTESVQEQVTFACESCGKKISFSGQRCGKVETCPLCGEYVDVPEANETFSAMEIDSTSADDTPDSYKFKPSLDTVSGSRTTRQLWIEVFAVLCLAYVPYLYSALLTFISGRHASSSVENQELSLIIYSLQISIPLLLIIALTRERWSLFGIVRPRVIYDMLGALALFFVAIVANAFLTSFLTASFSKIPASLDFAPRAATWGITTYLLILIAAVANGFAEELAMRGYLIARLERLLGSTWMAVLTSTLLFASYHLYQGVVNSVYITMLGLVYGIWFCLFRRLWPLVIAHALQNILFDLLR